MKTPAARPHTLEELYVQAVIAEVPYTMVQLMDEGINKIKNT